MPVYSILKLGNFIMLAPFWSNYKRFWRSERKWRDFCEIGLYLSQFTYFPYDSLWQHHQTLHAIYLDSNLNILIKDSIFFRPILSTPFPGSKIVFIFNTVFSFPLCDLLLDADNDLYLKKKMICAKFRWYIYYISCFDEDGNVKSSNVYQHLTRKA